MTQSCAFTGHRKISSDLSKNKLRAIILRTIEEGYDTFYCGMAYGFDLLCCSILAEYKKKYPLEVIACIPCNDQEKYYRVKDKKLYNEMCAICGEVKIFHEKYVVGCMHERDRYMVDHSSLLVAYVNDYDTGTGYTVNYASRKGKKIIFV